MKTQSYLVQWSIDIDAADPAEAAARALIVMRDNDPENQATIFEIRDEEGNTHVVDLDPNGLLNQPYTEEE